MLAFVLIAMEVLVDEFSLRVSELCMVSDRHTKYVKILKTYSHLMDIVGLNALGH